MLVGIAAAVIAAAVIVVVVVQDDAFGLEASQEAQGKAHTNGGSPPGGRKGVPEQDYGGQRALGGQEQNSMGDVMCTFFFFFFSVAGGPFSISVWGRRV